MLAHPGIELRMCSKSQPAVRLAVDGDVLVYGERFEGPVVYTGALDELMAYKLGVLPYRSLKLEFETLGVTEMQPAAVVNYPNEEAFTRITEFKKLTGQELPGVTTVLREYPAAYAHDQDQEPYYPIQNEYNLALYARYAAEAKAYDNLFLCGRLAEYKYYNMDAVVASALALSKAIVSAQVMAVS